MLLNKVIEKLISLHILLWNGPSIVEGISSGIEVSLIPDDQPCVVDATIDQLSPKNRQHQIGANGFEQ